MKRYVQGLCAGLALGGLLTITGCVGYAGGGAGVYYDYDYYPDWDVYYYPHDHIYYWNEGGAWRSGARAPDRYDFHGRHMDHLHVQNQHPWTEHHAVTHSGGDHHDHD